MEAIFRKSIQNIDNFTVDYANTWLDVKKGGFAINVNFPKIHCKFFSFGYKGSLFSAKLVAMAHTGDKKAKQRILDVVNTKVRFDRYNWWFERGHSEKPVAKF